MPRLDSRVPPDTDSFRANRDGMIALLENLQAIEARARTASEASRARFEARGQLLPRDRVALLLDPGRPFIELAKLAGYGMDTGDLAKSVPGAGMIAGIGFVSGIRAMIVASDSGIAAGALQPGGLKKILRLQEIALENKLPYLQLVESAGANLMDYRVEEFVEGGATFRNLARLSAAGCPVVTVTHGSSTAGGAYQTGLSDHIVMVRGRTRAFLAGPPLLKAATGEIATEEDLGGAEMHTQISGLGDHLAEDDRHAIAIAREIMAAIDWDRDTAPDSAPDIAPARPHADPFHDPEDLLGIMPMDYRQPVDMREVIARIADGSEFLETGARHGPGTVCGTARIRGWPIGIITNNGPLDPTGATKATHFIQGCCQAGTPILYLNNTTGFMVGRAYEEAGMIKHGSKMIQAVTNATVPQFTIYCGASFGAGNYGMCGRGFAPRFCFAWPNAKTAVMGGEQAAGTMLEVQRARAARKGEEVDEARLAATRAAIEKMFAGQMDALHTSARLLDDGVIDPRQTRELLAELMTIARDGDARTQPGPVRRGSPVTKTPFTRLLVANRGEIAVRVMRTARAMGIATVAVHSDADAAAEHVRAAGTAVRIGGPAPGDSYLRVDRIIDAARATGADAIHPGYGFLAENPALPRACAEAGIVFVGPSERAIASMGDKAAAKRLMQAAGVPCVPGYDGADQRPDTLAREARTLGFPIMIKATAGGGGRGMRLVAAEAEFDDALTSAVSEATTAFGDGTVILERAIINPRHVEIQVLADRHGNAIHLGERDCSVQRRHQKLIEEAPSPAVDADLRARMGAASVQAALAIGYEGAGTFEYLLDDAGSFHFMEMNTRLQVEHPVTEAVTGLDLVELQLRIAAGEPLPLAQADVTFDGHAMEVRLCAEDPDAGFVPQSGRIARWRPSAALRVDHALADGAEVPPFYDSMLAKLIAHGPDRDTARRRLLDGLAETLALGLRTNQGFLADALAHPAFAAGAAATGFIEDHRADLLPGRAEEEARIAGLAGAFLRAGPGTALAHGFPAPLRLARDDRVHAPRVSADAHGDCRIADAGALARVRVTGKEGDSVAFEAEGRSGMAHLHLGDGVVWLHLIDRAWDFRDLTLVPEITAEPGGDGRIRAAMTGTVVSVAVTAGDAVRRGDTLLVLEAMKMEHVHAAAIDGTVAAVHVAAGAQVAANAVLIEVAPDS